MDAFIILYLCLNCNLQSYNPSLFYTFNSGFAMKIANLHLVFSQAEQILA